MNNTQKDFYGDLSKKIFMYTNVILTIVGVIGNFISAYILLKREYFKYSNTFSFY